MAFVAGQRLTAAALNEATENLNGGLVRTSNDTSTSGTTEKVWATTATLSLRASTVYTLVACAYWTNTVNDDQFSFRIRETSVSGTIRNGIVGHAGRGGGPYSTWLSYTFTTTTATTGVWVATLVRSVGTGTAQVQAVSELMLFRRGASGLYTTA